MSDRVTHRAVVLATRSAGKLRELRPLFTAAGWTVRDLHAVIGGERPEEAAIECFATFEENALAKARWAYALAGVPVVADDSGLEVRALGGRPGVYSKRWSGRSDLDGASLDAANNATLLAALAGEADRRARYVCTAAYVDGSIEVVRRGETDGRIALEPTGDGGFGYDPYFVSDELGRTFGATSVEEKSRISHRGRAFRALLLALER